MLSFESKQQQFLLGKPTLAGALDDQDGPCHQNHRHHHHHNPHGINGGGTVVIHASSQMHMHDVLFHVIFGSDTECIFDFVHASAARLISITQCPSLLKMMQSIISEREHQRQQQQLLLPPGSASSLQPAPVFRGGRVVHGPDLIKALFFIFLNVDMVLKEYVCKPACKKAFAAAMNISPSALGTPAVENLHAWSMMGTRYVMQFLKLDVVFARSI